MEGKPRILFTTCGGRNQESYSELERNFKTFFHANDVRDNFEKNE